MAMNQEWPSRTDRRGDIETVFETATPLNSDSASATELLLSGLQIARAGDLDAAAEIFAKAILKDPESAEAYEALATVLVPLGKLEFASHAKAKAISLGYNSAPSWDMLGDMLMGLGKFQDAADAFRASLDLDPASSEVKSKLDNALLQCPRPPQAVASPAMPSSGDDAADLFGPEFLSANPIPADWQHVRIVTIAPDGHQHSAVFDDLGAGLEHALRGLDVTVERQNNAFAQTGINLVLGAHLIGTQELADQIPLNTVIINLEQITGFDVQGRPIYLSLLKRLAVWDYSVRNIAELRRITQNPNIRHFGVGYVPEMTRRLAFDRQPTDVLFYGSMNARRRIVLDALVGAGLNVVHLFSVYGETRDRAVAEAKVVLNMHFYEDSIHEIVRTSHLLANGKAVVSECGPKTEIDDDLRQAMLAVPYADLVASCVALVRDEPRRRVLERRAFEIFSQRDQAKMLRETIAATELPTRT